MNHQSGNVSNGELAASDTSPPLPSATSTPEASPTTPIRAAPCTTAVPMSRVDPTLQVLDRVTLNKGEDDQLECIGYRRSVCKSLLFYVGCVVSVGVLLLICHWKPYWRLLLTRSRCPLALADTVLLVDELGHKDVTSVVKQPSPSAKHGYSSCTVPNDGTHSITSPSKPGLGKYEYVESQGSINASDMDDRTVLTVRPKVFLKFFIHKHLKYIWDNELRSFKKLRGLDSGLSCAIIHDEFLGLTPDEHQSNLVIYGKNSIEVEVKSYPRLFIEEIVNPFYIFQICSVILWSLDDYYVYASCIVVISAISLGVELYETRKQRVTLRDMVSSAEISMSVIRFGGEVVEVPASQLVPGDMLLIPPKGCLMTCDAVLISGNAIVNESMLTGESVPVTKTPLAQNEATEIYDPDQHKRHTLFCGTNIIQTRYYGDAKVRAVVIRTGFSTSKGDLVRAIMFPKPIGFKFYQDSMKFIGFLACIAALGMTYSIVTLIRNGTPASHVFIRALDIITIVVPPALPAAMTVGTVYAQSRLKKSGIFCISPARINICGKLKCICFDKTGTLTEDGLDMWGVVPCKGRSFQPSEREPKALSQRDPVQIAMATCHSLTLIDGELSGDPLDLIMFQAINWVLEEPGTDTSRFDSLVPTIVKPIAKDSYSGAEKESFDIGIVRQFTFSSSLQRMSVITRVLGADHMELYCKGAPEKIATLCLPQSLPDDFVEVLHRYTIKGFRVLGLARRSLDPKLTWHQAQRISRDKVECELHFIGLLIMENSLKPQTTPVIRQLNTACIRTVMVTGDNLLTGISVARQCEMVGAKDKVILVNAHPPDGGKPAMIHWEYSEGDSVNSAEVPDMEQSLASMDTDNREVDFARDREDLYDSVVDVEETHRYHFAVTGRSFGVLRHHFPELMAKIVVRGTVFARMSPEQKSQLVELLQELDYCVGMCGDGANDCGALKAAHAGISLSEAEASVASPFTSKTANIECVPTVMREGRAALVTSFGVFKYMALYSMVQFVSVLILYTMRTNLGDWMFLYIDLVITTTVAVLMGHTGAYPQLVAKRPPGSLLAVSNMFSIIMHILLVCIGQTAAFLFLTTQSWYKEPSPVEGNEVNTFTQVTAVIFCVSSFQYLMLAFIFSKGAPYRKPIWHNIPFLVSLIVLTALTAFIVLYPPSFIRKILDLVYLPDIIFRVTLLGIVAVNFILCFVLESFILPSRCFNALVNTCRRKRGPKNKYKLIEQELCRQTEWPPVGGATAAKPKPSSYG